ncbi:Coiled-coil-helix-coiled-coil-helix domain-containing protein 8 [Caligus rogercresseyi]|uniref:Coiled-coil-helix-coiled-coil-helix domain-containing protein 8 n=1 Tax=Caligus rogercresseyi TaxID=217165 RepID=A0A7T8QX72_CALRO|nr:Coiled-coil-helix-coiled-coil-helix domain-containing protein 8 [Caligus rogercresseyi]
MSRDHHNRTRQPPSQAKEEEEEEDPLDRMLNKTGCVDLHYQVQFCMAEKKDWRLCQKEVLDFKTSKIRLSRFSATGSKVQVVTNTRKEQLGEREEIFWIEYENCFSFSSHGC